MVIATEDKQQSSRTKRPLNRCSFYLTLLVAAVSLHLLLPRQQSINQTMTGGKKESSREIEIDFSFLEQLSTTERKRLVFNLAAMPEWSVEARTGPQVPTAEKGSLFNAYLREEKNGALIKPQRMLHVGKKNPAEVNVTLYLSTTGDDTTVVPYRHDHTSFADLSDKKVSVALYAGRFGEDRLESRIAIKGSGIAIEVHELSDDRLRSLSKQALTELHAQLIQLAAIENRASSPQKNPLKPACKLTQAERSSYDQALYGYVNPGEAGYVLAKLAGYVSGKEIPNQHTPLELVGFSSDQSHLYYFRFERFSHAYRKGEHRIKLYFRPLQGGEDRFLMECQ